MKIIRIVFSRIQNYFINNRILFILFLIGTLSCSFTFIYFYGNAVTIKAINGKDADYMKNFTVSFRQPIECNKLNYGNETGNNVINTDYTHKLTSDEFSQGTSNIACEIQSKSKYNTVIYGERGRIQFTDDEINNKEYVIIIPSTFKDKNIGDKLTINKKDYTIIGVNNFSNIFYIPPTVFQDEFLADTVTITFDDTLSKAECENYINVLKVEYKDIYIKASPLTYYNQAENNMGFELITLGLGYIIAMLSFLFIMKYMVDKNSRETIIYAVVGANNKQVSLIMFLENLVLTLGILLVAIILHSSLYNAFFSKINIYSGITYSAFDYLIICVVVIVFSSLATIPFIKEYLKSTIIQNRSKYSVH